MSNNNNDNYNNPPLLFWISTFFVTVATILGTGILGLPTQLNNSGFWPFFFLFVPCLIGQACVVIFMIELLQYGDLIINKNKQLHDNHHVEMTNIKNNNNNNNNDDDDTVELMNNNNNNNNNMINSEDIELVSVSLQSPIDNKINNNNNNNNIYHNDEGPNLHFLGQNFLNPYLQFFFNLAVLLHFIAVLSSYALAGPQALGQIFNTAAKNFVVAFVIILTLIVVLCQTIIMNVISIVTLAKGLLLIIMVALTGYVGSKVNEEYNDDWRYINEPFLVSTVALGGVVNVMPVFYPQFSPTKTNLRKFRTSILLGLFVCWILNILWAAFVLQVVPQHSINEDSISLENAAEHGQIATEPLVKVIDQSFHEYVWISWIIRSFIALSVIVSFVALGSGFKHVLDGYVVHLILKLRNYNNFFAECWLVKSTNGELLLRSILYIFSFGCILSIALSDPEGFLEIIDRWASLALNLESGFFVALMLYNARLTHNHIELVLSEKLTMFLVSFTVFYFLSAVLYDLVDTFATI